MFTLFVLEGFWLWATLVGTLGLVGVMVHTERYRWATFDLLALLAVLTVTGNLSVPQVWQYVMHNPLVIVGGVIAYLVAGVMWARIKWAFLVHKLQVQVKAWRDRIEQENARKQAEHQSKLASGVALPPPMPAVPSALTVPPELQRSITVDAEARTRIRIEHFKSRITGWITYWPVSVVAWLVGDFISDVVDYIFRTIKTHFQDYADQQLNG